jgi:hypothetical protein
MTARGRLALLGGVWFSLVVGATGQSLEYVQVGEIRGPADIVEAHADRAYIVSDRTLTLFDLSNPATPVRGGTYSFPDKIWGIRVVGSLLYAAADKFGLGILDVSQASAPTLRGSFKTPGQSKSVAIVGSTALVADHMSGVNFIDVSDPVKPTSRGDYFLEGYARAVASNGSIAVAIDAPTGLYVFDLSGSGKLEPIGTLQSAERPGSVDLSAVSGPSGSRLAVLVGSGALQIFDLTNPTKPIKTATFRTPSGRPQGVALHGALAYVADSTEGLQIVDLTVPAAARIVGSFATRAPARSVAVTDSLVLVSVIHDSTTGAAGSALATDGSVLVLARRGQKP